MSTDILERLADALQTLAPLVQRLAVTSKQQQADAALALAATERAISDLRIARDEKGSA